MEQVGKDRCFTELLELKTRCGENRECNLSDLHSVVRALAVLQGSDVMLFAVKLGLVVPGVQCLGESIHGSSFAFSDLR